MEPCAVGVDVSVRRGLDVVVMAHGGVVLHVQRRCDPDGLANVLREWKPRVVAIDSPPGRGIDPNRRTRRCEEHRALEVFPHASDVFLRGCLPPAGTTRRVGSKRAWRSETLRGAGVDPASLCLGRRLPSMDSVDVALAALTGLRAIEGEYQSYGVDGEWLVVPSSATTGRFERCR